MAKRRKGQEFRRLLFRDETLIIGGVTVRIYRYKRRLWLAGPAGKIQVASTKHSS